MQISVNIVGRNAKVITCILNYLIEKEHKMKDILLQVWMNGSAIASCYFWHARNEPFGMLKLILAILNVILALSLLVIVH